METKKKQLRAKVKLERQQLTEDTYLEWSKQIHKRLQNIDYWKKAEVVAMSFSIHFEVDTIELIKECWKASKRVVLPRVNFLTKEMFFYEVTSFEQLEETKFSLKEPNVEKTNRIDINEIDFVLVPGVAFGKRGERLGYGGGFYDRFLAQTNIPKVALAFSFQVFAQIPVEIHDQRVDLIVTENEVISR
ncbi:hypothetical protein AJ85_20475 [Alkalihalobacillus alcalophilus ATCC 27647 = CGMCC 1.3604]|uniref:5-formyltetrahydrofolate cyclo-ligase n=2 Tax=Alkalihalobacillus alcalophilus TaxID=1445 RepID=A0A094WFE5_ALKAL|nr:5-formyltetrahydrofolate cyclo-ligase [Alkalihalobacillus alcalophilus]KGA95486.1 hypothetical protein BALCAV_0222270 [Alkalihalobacillus alcalophilus ATCC 27647 = CGMCC 1.3604]MED1564004.1 5-formyltetrahydrofolate cyclo-ligase [Alkalihalobacillus alcalophilus]THG88932.1 hypothetical protein AJ85_20475 [Alkalihalobacillus alcalophilus ATCC 27647 = CGMCC 1.3604]